MLWYFFIKYNLKRSTSNFLFTKRYIGDFQLKKSSMCL